MSNDYEQATAAPGEVRKVPEWPKGLIRFEEMRRVFVPSMVEDLRYFGAPEGALDQITAWLADTDA